ncbi:MAG: type I-E CRISPR-associated endonuclease Cas1 [Magnetococcales bacterium]|nr:type I-E CRISPR-associated endonuclease Cas1 [Magnetococcales bacterium]
MSFVPLKPTAIKERVAMVFLEYGQLDVIDGAFVLVDNSGVRTHIPVGSVACLMLEPGTRVSHAAVKLAAAVGTLLIWVGEAGVRLYAAGQPGGARSDRLLHQARMVLDPELRLKVVRKMYDLRFGEPAPQRRSIDQLRGIEGARVKSMYAGLAQQYGLVWRGRRYNPADWEAGDRANQCLSAANACLYGITEAAILAAGYAPAIGFLHSGKPLSFVYDIADIIKFETVVPVAFRIAAKKGLNPPERKVRQGCRDIFREQKVLQRLIPLIEEVLSAGGVDLPAPAPEAAPPAIPGPTIIGDIGHRSG